MSHVHGHLEGVPQPQELGTYDYHGYSPLPKSVFELAPVSSSKFKFKLFTFLYVIVFGCLLLKGETTKTLVIWGVYIYTYR